MTLALLLLGSVTSGAANGALADTEAEALYGRRCGGCHSLDRNRIGPRHDAVFGSKAGTAPNYPYSDAVRQSSVIWDEDTLDRWLTNPQALIPGQKMGYRLGNPNERRAIIIFLKNVAGGRKNSDKD